MRKIFQEGARFILAGGLALTIVVLVSMASDAGGWSNACIGLGVFMGICYGMPIGLGVWLLWRLVRFAV
jgi:hypothetical protein